jgi:hypothetical protein
VFLLLPLPVCPQKKFKLSLLLMQPPPLPAATHSPSLLPTPFLQKTLNFLLKRNVLRTLMSAVFFQIQKDGIPRTSIDMEV